jgi:hypothetical protein
MENVSCLLMIVKMILLWYVCLIRLRRISNLFPLAKFRACLLWMNGIVILLFGWLLIITGGNNYSPKMRNSYPLGME